MVAPIILLPPSGDKADGGRGRPVAPGSMSFPEPDAARLTIAELSVPAMSPSSSDGSPHCKCACQGPAEFNWVGQTRRRPGQHVMTSRAQFFRFAGCALAARKK